MTSSLSDLRRVSVVGIGLHPYQRPSETPYTQLGVRAIRTALEDAGVPWTEVESAHTGTATTAMGLSRLMYRHLGASGIPMVQVENASASGSTAFRQACHEVASGLSDVAIAVGVDGVATHYDGLTWEVKPTGTTNDSRMSGWPPEPRPMRSAGTR